MFYKNKNTRPGNSGNISEKPAGGRSKKAKKPKKRLSSIPLYQRPIICPPDRSGMSLKVRISGFICRALLIFFSVFGLSFFVVDALYLEKQGITVSAGFIALVALISVAVFSAMRTSKIGLAVGSLAVAGGLFKLAYDAITVPALFSRALITAKDVVLTRLFNRGYLGMSLYITNLSYSAKYTAEFYFKYAVVFFVVLLSLGFVLSMIKRVRVLFPAIVSTLVLVGVFTVNISRSNWGVALVIASFVGLLVMAGYDRIFLANPDSGRYDTKTILFEYQDRPPLDEEADPKAEKAAREAARREYRKLKKQRRREGAEISVDEELSAYFGTSKKSKKTKPEKQNKKLTPEEKRAEAAIRREKMARISARRKYDQAVHDSRAAQGGFAAIGAFVLAMLMLLIPVMTVSGSFSTISVIDKRMEHYREIVEALLMGDDPKLDEIGYMYDKDNFIPRSTDATPPHFTGAKVFTVETHYATPVYLRGWIGVDYKNGAWYPATDEQLEAYRKLYGTSIDPTEAMFSSFYSFMNPSAIATKDFSKQVTSSTRYGFVVMQVNLARVETEDSMVYMPSFLRSDEVTKAARNTVNKGTKPDKDDTYGLYEYGTNTPSGTSFVNYFDGIYTGRKFMSELQYAAVSNVTTMKNADWYEYVSAYIADYNRGYLDAVNLIDRYADRLGGNNQNSKRSAIEAIQKVIFADTPSGLLKIETDDAAGTTTIYVKYERGTGVYVYDINTKELKSRTVIDRKTETYVDPLTGETVTYELAFVAPDLNLEMRYHCGLMTEAEKAALVLSYYEQYKYKNFVYDTYLEKADSSVISDMLKVIKESAVDIKTVYSDDEYPVASTVTTKKDFSLAAIRNTSDAAAFEQRHELVMEIINYLKENYTYTLTPTQPVSEGLDGVENFLSVTKEGYCVQFASSLALLLREAGIPARYVEGYIASGFNRNYSADAAARYIATVRDYNAHAWVEVWYDGIGWVQYEATPPYYNDMYVKESGEGSSGGVRPGGSDTEVTPEQEMLDSLASSFDFAELRIESMREDLALLIGGADIYNTLDRISSTLASFRETLASYSEEYESSTQVQGYDRDAFLEKLGVLSSEYDSKIDSNLNSLSMRIESLKETNKIIWLTVAGVIILLVLAAFFAAVAIRAKKTEQQRINEITRISTGNFTDEEREALARRLIDSTNTLLYAYGSSPKPGEFRDEYADRLRREYIGVFGKAPDSNITQPGAGTEWVVDTDFRAIFRAIAAEEFGYGMTRDETQELAKFYLLLRKAAKSRLSLAHRAILHLVKRII